MHIMVEFKEEDQVIGSFIAKINITTFTKKKYAQKQDQVLAKVYRMV